MAKKQPIKKINKKEVAKGIKTEEKYEKQTRAKVGKKMPVQARVALHQKDKIVGKAKKKI